MFQTTNQISDLINQLVSDTCSPTTYIYILPIKNCVTFKFSRCRARTILVVTPDATEWFQKCRSDDDEIDLYYATSSYWQSSIPICN